MIVLIHTLAHTGAEHLWRNVDHRVVGIIVMMFNVQQYGAIFIHTGTALQCSHGWIFIVNFQAFTLILRCKPVGAKISKRIRI